ncbi:type II secretion system F family protein [Arthrobacter sp. LAPM80]|uniref:type II secretion system F family protein n=1 Tax=Arthrobacter sp. LAPM80 TaxID=3141788 RepID=UPI00398AF280
MPLLLQLLGTALDSGLTVQGALGTVAGISAPGIRDSLLRVVAGLEIGASWQNSWDGNTVRADVAQIHDALSFGALTGASAAPLLYAEARRCRTAASRHAEKRAAALGVKLVLPLGLCSLPAFIALGIVPVVMAMIPKL